MWWNIGGCIEYVAEFVFISFGSYKILYIINEIFAMKTLQSRDLLVRFTIFSI